MSVIAAALKHMLAAGMPPEDIIRAVAEMEAELVPQRTKRQERNARYYQNRKATASETALIKTIETVQDGSDAAAEMGKKEVSPDPSKKKLPLPSQTSSAQAFPAGERQGRGDRGHRLPDDWQPTADDRQFAIELGLPEDQIDPATAEFGDFWRSVPGAKGRKLDWSKTWRNRIREVVARLKLRGGVKGATGPPSQFQVANAYDPGLMDRLRERIRQKEAGGRR